jgi:HlyD family secretion protein
MKKTIAESGIILWGALAIAIFGGVDCRNNRNQNEISASGTIEAVEVGVSSKTSGQVVNMAVDEGGRVNAGDLLAVVDSSSLEIQLRQTEAGVKLAEAQLRLLLKGARIEDIRQAEEALRQAEAGLKLAEVERSRITDLFAKQSATAQQRDNAETRLAVARAQHEAAKQALQKWRQLARPEEIKQAQARLEQAEASRDLLKKTIADSTISSPTSGIVTHRATEQGEFVVPGTILLTIADLAEVRLEIFVPESDLGKVRLGQSAEVRIDSYPDRIFKGQVIFISPEAEFTPKNIQTKEERVKLVYRVKIKVPNAENILKPGMPADAVIDTQGI